MVERNRTYFTNASVSANKYNMYTCPANARAVIPLIYINNSTGGGAVTVLLEIYKSDDTTSYELLTGHSLAAGAVVKINEEFGIVLEPNDRIDITCTGGGTVNVDALCTVHEQFVINRT